MSLTGVKSFTVKVYYIPPIYYLQSLIHLLKLVNTKTSIQACDPRKGIKLRNGGVYYLHFIVLLSISGMWPSQGHKAVKGKEVHGLLSLFSITLS